MRSYDEFIQHKREMAKPYGFRVKSDRINQAAFDWQARIIEWTLRRGRAAVFAECGLGKTLIQLEWAHWVHKKTKQPVVIHCPVGVRRQTKQEAEKFGIKSKVAVVDSQSELINGINLINYEKAHKFDFNECSGVVLDESQILKSLDGKTRQLLTTKWSHVDYRLACTATPAPNDHMELGNHAEFLGICPALDMLSKYFVHDSGDTSKWRLRKYAVQDFWRWVASWAVCVSKPSDLDGDDTGFDLPDLTIDRHIVEVYREPPKGRFFASHAVSATNIHSERRLTNDARCERAVELATADDDFCIIWCDTNYEADKLAALLPDAVEVRGSESDRVKEQKLADFSNQKYKRLISKPSIAGLGMNWQHCNHMVYAGLSYSFEKLYQSIRRCWRFGQERPVLVDIVLADTDSSVNSAIARKSSDFELMRSGMAEAMREGTLLEFGLDNHKTKFEKTEQLILPDWL